MKRLMKNRRLAIFPETSRRDMNSSPGGKMSVTPFFINR